MQEFFRLLQLRLPRLGLLQNGDVRVGILAMIVAIPSSQRRITLRVSRLDTTKVPLTTQSLQNSDT